MPVSITSAPMRPVTKRTQGGRPAPRPRPHKDRSGIGVVLKLHRQRLGLSLRDLALRIDRGSRGYLSMVERGKIEPSVAILFVIARALGIPASQLVKEAESANGPHVADNPFIDRAYLERLKALDR